MPQEVVHRITQIGRAQGMPSRITYANRCGDEISDRLEDFLDDSDSASTDSEDDTYVTDTDDDASSVSDDETTSTSDDDDDDPHDDHDLPDREIPAHAALLPPGTRRMSSRMMMVHHPLGTSRMSSRMIANHLQPMIMRNISPSLVLHKDRRQRPTAAKMTTPLRPCRLSPHRLNMTDSRPPKKPVVLRVTYKSPGDVFPHEKRPPPITRLYRHHYSFLTEQMSAKKGLRQFDKKELMHR